MHTGGASIIAKKHEEEETWNAQGGSLKSHSAYNVLFIKVYY